MNNSLSILKHLGFHYSELDMLGKPHIHDNFVFDANVQVEWDVADDEINDIMVADITACKRKNVFNNKVSVLNLAWIAEARRIAIEKMASPKDSKTYIDLYYLMDGIISCYIVLEKETESFSMSNNKKFDLLIDDTNLVKLLVYIPYIKQPIITPVLCTWNYIEMY